MDNTIIYLILFILIFVYLSPSCENFNARSGFRFRAPTPRTPTRTPTRSPTRTPTRSPTRTPTRSPTRTPTRSPTRTPTRPPTRSPPPPRRNPPTDPKKNPPQVTSPEFNKKKLQLQQHQQLLQQEE